MAINEIDEHVKCFIGEMRLLSAFYTFSINLLSRCVSHVRSVYTWTCVSMAYIQYIAVYITCITVHRSISRGEMQGDGFFHLLY